MRQTIKNKAGTMALSILKEKVMNPNLAGIGVVKSIDYKNGKLAVTIVLEGLEDHPLSVEASEINIASDGSTVKIGKYLANLPFAQHALDQFGKRPFTVPEGSARTGLLMAKKLLGL